jgi:multidrug resistance protein, MATE family
MQRYSKAAYHHTDIRINKSKNNFDLCQKIKIDMFSEHLTTELKTTIKLAIPIIIAQLGVILMGVTDNLMVGRMLGTTALGAAGLANSIAFMISSIAIGGLSVVAPMVSKAKAEGNNSEINRLFRASIKAALWFALVFGIITFFTAYYFEIFRQTSEITNKAREFMYILAVANLPMFLFIAAKQLSDGLSKTRVAMVITVIALFVNWLFNWLLIGGNLGFPNMGLNGSAISTLLARIFMMVAILFYILRNKRFKEYFLEKYNSLITNELVIKIFKIGIPGGLQFFFEIAAFSLAVVMMGWLGEDRLAAHQIAINLASVTYMMASGIAYAGAIRVGNGWGMKSRKQIRTSGNAAFLLSIIFMGMMALIMLIFRLQLIHFYIFDEKVVTIAMNLMIIAAIFQLSDGVQVVALGAMRGLSDVNIPTIITLFAYWIVALPLGYFLGFFLKLDAEGIWIGLLAGLTASAILLTLRFYFLVKKLKF